MRHRAATASRSTSLTAVAGLPITQPPPWNHTTRPSSHDGGVKDTAGRSPTSIGSTLQCVSVVPTWAMSCAQASRNAGTVGGGPSARTAWTRSLICAVTGSSAMSPPSPRRDGAPPERRLRPSVKIPRTKWFVIKGGPYVQSPHRLRARHGPGSRGCLLLVVPRLQRDRGRSDRPDDAVGPTRQWRRVHEADAHHVVRVHARGVPQRPRDRRGRRR